MLSGSLEINLVSRVYNVGVRADLFCLVGFLVLIGFLPLLQILSVGYFYVDFDYLKLFGVIIVRDTSEAYLRISLL